MDCAELTGDQARPTIPGEYVIEWSRLLKEGEAGDWTVAQTIEAVRAEHTAFVTRLRERERPVALYVVRLEGRLFACADDAAWLRDYTNRLPTP